MLSSNKSEFTGLAELEYSDGEFFISKPGAYVLCAETGKQIPLQTLAYWSVELQEAYVDADAALVRWKSLKKQELE